MRSRLRMAAWLLALGAATAAHGRAAGNSVPVADVDGDGVVRGDRCPDVAGLEPDGCPPTDWDGDWVVDGEDRCPREPGPRESAGCPDIDSDGDGLADRGDRCPTVFGHPRFEGCPPPDTDRDAVVDSIDACVGEREIWNGRRDADGCADRGLARLTVEEGALVLTRVASDGMLSAEDRRSIAMAARALDAAMAREVRVEVVTAHGQSYGHSIGRARLRAAGVATELRRHSKLPIVEDPRGPDGQPRVVLRFR